MKAEDWGIMKPGSFADIGKDNGYSEEDLKLMRDELAAGEKKGYGKIPILKGKKSTKRVTKLHTAGYETKEVTLPDGDIAVLKRKKRPLTAWQLHVKATKAKNRGKSFTAILKLASASYKKK